MRLRISFPLAATAGLVTAIGLVVSISFLAWSSLHGIVKDLGEAARPDLRLVLAKDIAYALTDAENSVQAYIVAPDSVNITPYFNALANVDGKLDSLQRVSKGDSSRAVNDTLALIVGQKFAVLDSMLALRKADFMDSALKRIAGTLNPVTGKTVAEVKTAVSKDKGTAAAPVASADADKEKSGIFKKIFNKKKNETANVPASLPSTSAAEKAIVEPADPKLDFKKLRKQLSDVRAADQAENLRVRTRELSLMQRSQDLSVHLRRIIADIEAAESSTLIHQTEKSEASAGFANTIIIVFSVTGALLLFFIGYSIFAFARRTAEQKRVIQYAKEQAEQLAEDRERFVATMSHEIRTPMNAILGFSDQMLQGDLNQDQRKHAEIVKDSSLHLLAVVNSVLDFTQLAAGKLKLAQVGFHLREETGFIIELLRQTAEKKGISLSLAMHRNVPEIIIGDPLRYRQILLNLLNNAIKFTDEGEVRLSLDVEPGPASGREVLKLQVQDTGIGIPADRLEAIFGEYEQVSAQTKQKFGGTGLGLSITHMLLSLQGGSIKVESELGKGTLFTVRLPYQVGKPSDIESVQENKAPKAHVKPGLRILVADDEAYNRLLLTTVLKHWNANWVEVPNGEAALIAFDQSNFDILILDMRMPILSGLEVAAAVRKNADPKKAATPIIALTAGVNAEERSQCNEMGINHVLSKPLLTTSLAAAINDLHPSPQTGQEDSKVAVVGTHLAHGDLRQLLQLAQGNVAFMDELLQTYLRSLESTVAEITASVAAQDWVSIADLCHKIIPPTQHVEARELLALFKALEKSCRKGTDADEIRSLFRRAERESGIVAEELRVARKKLELQK